MQEFFLGDGAPPQQRGQVELGTGLEDPRGLDTAEAGIGLALINDSRRGFTLSLGMDLEATRDIRDDRFRPGFEPYLLAYQDVGPVGFNLQLKFLLPIASKLPALRRGSAPCPSQPPPTLPWLRRCDTAEACCSNFATSF